MDSDFQIDIGEVQRAIDVGEITALYFPLMRRTLLMDTRTTAVDGPMIKVVPMASSPEERFRELVRMRPRLPKPESINIVPWPKYVASLVHLNVWDHIVRRYIEIGPPETVKRCEEALKELKSFEQEELRRAIVGEQYETLWDAQGTYREESAEVDDDDEEMV